MLDLASSKLLSCWVMEIEMRACKVSVRLLACFLPHSAPDESQPRGPATLALCCPLRRRTTCACSAAGRWRWRRCGPPAFTRAAALPKTRLRCTASTVAVRWIFWSLHV